MGDLKKAKFIVTWNDRSWCTTMELLYSQQVRNMIHLTEKLIVFFLKQKQRISKKTWITLLLLISKDEGMEI